MTAHEPPAPLLCRAADFVEGTCPLGDSWYAEEGKNRERLVLVAPHDLAGDDLPITIATVPPGTWAIDNAAWIAMCGPQLWAALVDLLRGAARDAEEVGADSRVVALARALLGEVVQS